MYKIKGMALEHAGIKLDKYTVDNGKKVRSMDKVSLSNLTNPNFLAAGPRVKEREMDTWKQTK